MKSTTLCMMLLFLCRGAAALEPVNAFDDGFSVPLPGGGYDAVMLYPGAESLGNGPFLSAGHRIPFGMNELAETCIVAGIGGGKAGFSLSYSGTGFDLYNEHHEKIGFSYAPAGWLLLGLRGTFHTLRIAGFGEASTSGMDAGAVLRPREDILLALSVEDVLGAEIGESLEPVDGAVRGSASWAATESATFLVSAKKTDRWAASVTGGALFTLAPAMQAGITGATEPDRVEYLASLLVRGFRVVYRGSWHPELGITHGFSLGWPGTPVDW